MTDPSGKQAPDAPPIAATAREEAVILARLSFPIAIAQFGLVSLSLVDTAIVGRSSVDDLAATAMGRSIVFAFMSLGMGVALALEPLASQAVGAGEHGRAYGALRASLVAGALMVPVLLAASFVATLGLPWMGVDAALVPRVQAFLLGNAPGMVGFLGFLAGKTFLQAHGMTRPTLIAAAVANAVNPIVCSLLVRGDDVLSDLGLPAIGLPRLGALGAGLASSVATLVLAGMVLAAARARRPAVVDHVPLATVFRLGTPVGFQFVAEIGVFSLVGLIAGRLGARVVSAHQIALGLASFTFMGALGVSGATSARVGHAIGAGVSPRRAGILGLVLGAGVMVVGAIVFASFPRQLMSLFTKDADVIALGAPLLRIAALFQLFDGVQAVAAGALRGAGDVRVPFLANVGAHWFIGLPISLALGFGLGLGAVGLWWGLTAGLVSVAALLTARFLVLSRRVIARV